MIRFEYALPSREQESENRLGDCCDQVLSRRRPRFTRERMAPYHILRYFEELGWPRVGGRRVRLILK